MAGRQMLSRAQRRVGQRYYFHHWGPATSYFSMRSDEKYTRSNAECPQGDPSEPPPPDPAASYPFAPNAAAPPLSASPHQTVGEVRAAVARLGEHAWSINPRLKDDDSVPLYSLGGDDFYHPNALDVAPLDMARLLDRPIGNPLLAARNQQLRTMPVKLVFTLGVDWRNRWGGQWLTTIQNQNPCNNCWAFAATALVETMIRIEHGVWAKRSEGDMRDGWGGPTGENWVVRDGPKATPCAHGAGVTGALDWITSNGIADPDCYPWAAADKNYAPTADRSGRTARIGKYEEIGSNEDAKKWLDAVGPIICSFDAYSDFQVYGGPQPYRKSPTATRMGIHFMLVVGYDDVQQAWIVRNSWGTGWGMNGYGLIAYGECNIDGPAKLGLRNTNPDPWSKRRLHSGNFFESGNGPEHRNFEMVRGDAPRVRHLWRDGGSGGFTWHEAATLEDPSNIAAGAGCVGQPAATSTTFNRNFEAVYWELSGRLRHWFMDQLTKTWHDTGPFGPTDVEGFPAFIQSNYGAPGNMEVVVRRRTSELVHWWRDSRPPYSWHAGVVITSGVKMSGPSLVQANIGKQGNLYVVCVTNRGTMQLWWRDDDKGTAWKPGEVFGKHIGSTPVCMIQGQFGAVDELTPGNFELCVAVGGRVEHWFRDNSALGAEAPRADSADPRFEHVVYSPTKASYIASDAGTRLRADIESLFIDDDEGRIEAKARAGLYNAVVSAAPPDRWQRLAVFGHDVKHVWGLVEGSFGFNLEVVVERTDGVLQHYYRDGLGWHEAEIVDA